MSASTIEAEHYHLEEGHVCVDFVNTAYIQLDETAPHGYLTTEERLGPADLPALGEWGQELGLIPADEAALLTSQPAGAGHDRLEGLRAIRESLRRVFRAHIFGEPIPAEDLEAINQTLAPMLAQTQLQANDGGFQRDFTAPGGEPALDLVFDRLTWAIAQSTFDLLSDPDELDMIRECPGDDCGYLFRDTSHGRRRWCSMKSCGNRAKVQAFRDRQKSAAS
jgi:predicted RNA-binding Zn ribbon-like protein